MLTANTNNNTNTPYVYKSHFICENDTVYYKQPEKITKTLKTHQLASLYKIQQMEENEYMYYNIQDGNPTQMIFSQANGLAMNNIQQKEVKMSTNVGIIGDIVGYGKTLIALSLISEFNINNIHVPETSKNTLYSDTSYLTFEKKINHTNLIKTTLVIVPRGPVYNQWYNSIQNDTNLKCLNIENLTFIKKNLPATVQEFKNKCAEYDLVLIKETTLAILIKYYRETNYEIIDGFSRIIIDEAHIIIRKIKKLRYNFMWLITSNYSELINQNTTGGTIYDSFYSIICNQNGYYDSSNKLLFLLVKNDIRFIKRSFDIPQPIERYYICKTELALSAIYNFFKPSIQEKINANDINGVISELGGINTTENNIVKITIDDIDKQIENLLHKITYYESLNVESAQKQHNIDKTNNLIKELTRRKNNIEERISEMNSSNCPICYDKLENPIFLQCTHMFCGNCIFNWMNTSGRYNNRHFTCPQCKQEIKLNCMIGIIKDYDNDNYIQTNNNKITIKKTKEEMLIEIIKNKPNGKFLIFSNIGTIFEKIRDILISNIISHSEIKGSTGQMSNILNKFNKGDIKVIMLNTIHAGCGIDISNATDVIIFHNMDKQKIQAVGRAQRVGRSKPLYIHNLCYSHELLS